MVLQYLVFIDHVYEWWNPRGDKWCNRNKHVKCQRWENISKVKWFNVKMKKEKPPKKVKGEAL
jgi:hypothetical protein